MQSSLWTGVSALIDRSPSIEDLFEQGLHLLAADHWRSSGREVAAPLALAELIAHDRLAAAHAALAIARKAFDGRFVVLKGPEVAGHYLRPELRSFGDLDLLSDEPDRLQAALIDAGCRPEGSREARYYTGLHHLQPLVSPGPLSLIIEVHRHPNWIRWNDPPRFDDLWVQTVPSKTGVVGVQAIHPAAHAVLVAVHGWAETPLRRVADLVDVAVLLDSGERESAAAHARAFGVGRLWATTVRATDTVLFDAGRSLAVRTWARNLVEARRRAVYETHLRSWVSPFWARPPGLALKSSAEAIWHDLTPTEAEAWSGKLRRAAEAMRHPTRPNVEHERILGPRGIQPRFKRRP